MATRTFFALLTAGSLAIAAIPRAATANAQPLVHPIFAQLPQAPQNELALKRFTEATRRFGLGPVEVVDIEGPPTPKAPELLKQGQELVRRLQHAPGQAALDEAAAEIMTTGGAGLDARGLSDLFLYRAWAVSRADFNTDRAPTSTARAQAFSNLVRAVTFTPTRELNAQQYPPVIVEDWARARAEINSRTPVTLVVPASADALVICDGGRPLPGPATFAGLAQGEHLIRIEEPGYAPWGGLIALGQPTVTLEIPARRTLHLGDAVAAAHARRMGARYALVAEPRPGDGPLSLSLALVDLAGARRNSARAALGGEGGALESTVMRLDEDARRLERAGGDSTVAPTVAPSAAAAVPATPAPVLVSEAPKRPGLADDPAVWARQHWPLLTAIGVMAATTFALSIAVAADK